MKSKILIYGAGGYMGKLFTQYAQNANLPIVLGSRDMLKSDEEVRLFTLNDVNTIATNLYDISLVVNLAGPFVHTQRPFLEACLQTGTHYIDISGETSEFESALNFDLKAKDANIMIMPGAGFGVVPTDIAAKLAHEKLPDASYIKIAYVTVGGATRGTLKTVLKDIHREGIEIINGKSVKAKPAKSDFHLNFDGNKQRLVYNPWRGDLITAQYSTNIPNIKTFSNFPGFVESMMKGKLLWLRNLILNNLINLLPVGPSEKALKKGKTYVYAEVENTEGHTAQVNIIGPEAYIFTAQTLTNITQKILSASWKPGFQTPAIYGKEILSSSFQNVTIK